MSNLLLGSSIFRPGKILPVYKYIISYSKTPDTVSFHIEIIVEMSKLYYIINP